MGWVEGNEIRSHLAMGLPGFGGGWTPLRDEAARGWVTQV